VNRELRNGVGLRREVLERRAELLGKRGTCETQAHGGVADSYRAVDYAHALGSTLEAAGELVR